MKRRRTSIVVLLAAGFALAAIGCHRETAAAPALPAVAVHTAEVRAITEQRRTELPGTVRAVERAALAPKVMGTVASLPVTLGQSVKRGDTLATLTANEIGARLAQAEAGLGQARRDLERETSLLAKGAAAADTVRSAEDRVRLAEATVAEARTMLTYTTITAPFDGVITRRLVNEGDLASPGVPLLEIENPALQRVEVEVPDSLAAGAAVRSGQFARVAWPAGEGKSLVVPAAAVSAFGQMERVFVIADRKATMRLVKTGARHGAEIEILSGLAAGESIVANPTATLRDGQAVEVKP